MTLVVSISANTAAYAAQAVKPSAQFGGDRTSDEAVTLLSPKLAKAVASPPPLAPVVPQAWVSLMMLNARERQLSTAYDDVLKAYEENTEEPEAEPNADDQADDHQDHHPDDDEQVFALSDGEAFLALPPPEETTA